MSVSQMETAPIFRIEGPHLAPPPDARDLLAIYAQSLPRGIERLLGPPARLIDLLERVADWQHCLIARDTRSGAALGIMGLKSHQGSFVQGIAPGLRPTFGWFGAAWRGFALSALDIGETDPVLLIDGIAVAPEQRGFGIGTALIHAGLGHAAKQGKAGLRLDVDPRNGEAMAFYAALGFTTTDTRYLPLKALPLRLPQIETLTLYQPGAL